MKQRNIEVEKISRFDRFYVPERLCSPSGAQTKDRQLGTRYVWYFQTVLVSPYACYLSFSQYIFVFLLWRVFSPASLLSLLLFMAGIELNPGPKIWICSVCNKQIRKTHASVRCNICNNWCHFLACSGLSDLGSYNNTFVASCCLGAASSSSSVSDLSPFASPIASSHSSSHYNTPISSPHLSPPRIEAVV